MSCDCRQAISLQLKGYCCFKLLRIVNVIQITYVTTCDDTFTQNSYKRRLTIHIRVPMNNSRRFFLIRIFRISTFRFILTNSMSSHKNVCSLPASENATVSVVNGYGRRNEDDIYICTVDCVLAMNICDRKYHWGGCTETVSLYVLCCILHREHMRIHCYCIAG